MKRNDMIKEMAHESFRKLSGCDVSSPSFPYEVAECMLDVCEKLGMLPPERWRPMDWHERGMTYSQWLQEPSKIREWENEKETDKP